MCLPVTFLSEKFAIILVVNSSSIRRPRRCWRSLYADIPRTLNPNPRYILRRDIAMRETHCQVVLDSLELTSERGATNIRGPLGFEERVEGKGRAIRNKRRWRIKYNNIAAGRCAEDRYEAPKRKRLLSYSRHLVGIPTFSFQQSRARDLGCYINQCNGRARIPAIAKVLLCRWLKEKIGSGQIFAYRRGVGRPPKAAISTSAVRYFLSGGAGGDDNQSSSDGTSSTEGFLWATRARVKNW